MTAFKKAERKAKPLKLAMAGPSGSGKTYSALLLARGLVGKDGKIAIIDTESGASNFYDHLTDFDVATLEIPAAGKDYIEVMQMAVDGGYDVIIIDSISHDWEAVIEKESELPSKNMNTWLVAKRDSGHAAFFKYLFKCPVDVICTVRSEQAYEVGRDDKGNITKKNVGLRPRQQPNFEYDFDLIFDIDMDSHVATPGGLGKNRTSIWQGDKFVITENHGKVLREWRDSGSEWQEPIQGKTQSDINRYVVALGWQDTYKDELKVKGFGTKISEMAEAEAQSALKYLKSALKKKEKPSK